MLEPVVSDPLLGTVEGSRVQIFDGFDKNTSKPYMWLTCEAPKLPPSATLD